MSPALPRGAALRRAVLGGLCLGAATPPAWFPGAEWLVVVGLGLWFRLARSTGPGASYLLGTVHMALFSWSVRHVLWPAYAAIVLLGGCYYLAVGAAVRRVGARWSGLAFAFAVAGSCWLRSAMPELHYPHGQPCHALWQWPWLLWPLALGGEPLLNALLAWLAAALAQVAASWRMGVPRGRTALAGLLGVLLLWLLLAALGAWLRPTPAPDAVQTVTVAAVEPGVHPFDPYVGLPSEARSRRFRELYAERLVAPVRGLLAEAPDLILWPESSVPLDLAVDAALPPLLPPDLRLPERTLLLVGANAARPEGVTPAALLVGPDGALRGSHEKQRLVPGGEFVPFLRWLPEAVRAFVREQFAAALGSVPDCVPGRSQPPLRTAAGVPFGALLCYDNAFPEPAAAAVAKGAQFLCVLSNEAWYRGGGELSQLVAMTVCRAIELGVPIVRCTTDGWSAVVGANGELVAQLPIRPAPTPGPRILRSSLQVAPVGVGALAWLRAAAGPISGVVFGLLILHAARSWAKLRAARTAPAVPAAGAQPPTAGRTGS